MRSTLLFLPAALILCAATTYEYRSLLDEAAPSRLPVPVAGIRSAQLRDTWGAARSEGRTHEGIDIPARRGTPVLSTTHGIVSAVQWRDRGGNTVSVHGPGGYSHYYAHLDSYGRYAVGERVEAGDTLGFVGNTGNAQGTAPHLHYGIYTSGGAINPYPLLTGTAPEVTPPAAPAQASGRGKAPEGVKTPGGTTVGSRRRSEGR